MPWCDGCDRFYNPNTLNADGTCPQCGRQVAEPSVAPPTPAAARPADKTPWHFKVLVLGVVGYLGWRLVEGVIWVAERL